MATGNSREDFGSALLEADSLSVPQWWVLHHEWRGDSQLRVTELVAQSSFQWEMNDVALEHVMADPGSA